VKASAPASSLEVAISVVLRVGVVISTVVILIGIGLTFAQHPAYLHSAATLHHLTRVRGAFPHTPSQIVQGLSDASGPAVVMLGLFLLLLTPVVRVAVSIWLFATERPLTMAWLATAVLVIVLASFVLGRAGT
jgi:uncharacterized membrane protein